MAQYKKEISKWIFILLDKVVFDQSFRDPTGKLSAEEAYLLARFEEGGSIDGFLRSLKLERKKAQQILKRLLELHYLEKKADPLDKRKRGLFFTEKGKKHSLAIQDSMEHHLDLILKDLSVNEEIAVLKFISKINQLTVGKYEIK